MPGDEKRRCGWVTDDPLYIRYHDEEWGVPVHDECRLLEFIILGGAQAGLSWITILRKRDNYRAAFRRFDPRKVASFGARDVKRLLGDSGIVRNRAKIEAGIGNARAFLDVQREFGSFDHYLWSRVGHRTVHNRWKRQADIPPATAMAEELSRNLKSRGFTFVGPIICYSIMQAVGMVNDHVADCFRYRELKR